MVMLEDGGVGCDDCNVATAYSEDAALEAGWAREKVGREGVLVVNHICPDCLAQAAGR
jgi:hypothetical protein